MNFFKAVRQFSTSGIESSCHIYIDAIHWSTPCQFAATALVTSSMLVSLVNKELVLIYQLGVLIFLFNKSVVVSDLTSEVSKF